MQRSLTTTKVCPTQDRKNLEDFIDQSLLGSWVIHVEYLDHIAHAQWVWQRWGKTMFAIASPSVVLMAIDSCHAIYPANEIRICAENMQPEIRLVYTVYR